MTPSKAIAMLDRQIAAHGQTIALRRGSAAQHNARAVVRGFKPEQFVGLVTQADRHVIISPTALGAFGIPMENDEVAIAGRIGRVQADVEPIHIDDVLVRVNMRVRLT